VISPCRPSEVVVTQYRQAGREARDDRMKISGTTIMM